MAPAHPSGCTCGDEDSHTKLEGQLTFLYPFVDRDKVVALNAEEGKEAKIVIRPWDQRMREDEWLESDADEQLILRIPFTGSVKLRSILIKAGPSGFTPDRIKVFANRSLDFDEASSTEVTQEFEVAVTREVAEYIVRPAKFPSVTSLTLFFPSNHGEDTTRISFVGFKGEYSPLTRDPIITVYEAQANPADHQKIPGLDTTAHSRIG
ncbi:PITH domain-containing protein [Sporobolomyces salmoneus]|uniref:PITH domain-containing protein n=1 Tax=Sporobolomyces salmoneus TaxID=183962 RepID=UPI00317A6AE1